MYARLLGITFALAGLWVAGTVAAKPGTTTPVPLIVHVENSPGIAGDGPGGEELEGWEGSWSRYENGVDGVAASIDQYGNLIVNFQTVRSAPVRKLHYDYDLPLDGQSSLDDADPPNNYISTQRHDGAALKMQDIAEGGSGCYIGGVYYTLEDAERTQYWHSFGRQPVKEIDVSATARLKVTRSGPDTWVVESVNDCNRHSGRALVFRTPTVGKFKYTSEGHFAMPFRMVLTRQ
jgi:hypothetical protein